MKEFTFTLSETDVNIILEALSGAPYVRVFQLMPQLQQQIQAQLQSSLGPSPAKE